MHILSASCVLGMSGSRYWRFLWALWRWIFTRASSWWHIHV